jgi:hypothetical protein
MEAISPRLEPDQETRKREEPALRKKQANRLTWSTICSTTSPSNTMKSKKGDGPVPRLPANPHPKRSFRKRWKNGPLTGR